MDSLVALIERANREDKDESDPVLTRLINVAHRDSSYCPEGSSCEVRLHAESVVSSTATRIELHGRVERRQDFGEWASRGAFREMLEWNGKRWGEVGNGRNSY
jgi:hypothetical protein